MDESAIRLARRPCSWADIGNSFGWDWSVLGVLAVDAHPLKKQAELVTALDRVLESLWIAENVGELAGDLIGQTVGSPSWVTSGERGQVFVAPRGGDPPGGDFTCSGLVDH